MVLETRAGLEAGVIGAGHRFAAMRLDAQRSAAGWAKEAMSGVSYLGFIRALAQRVDSEWDAVQVRASADSPPGLRGISEVTPAQGMLCPGSAGAD